MKHIGRKWSAADDAIIRDGYAKGYSLESIAANLSTVHGYVITRNAVTGRAARLHLSHKYPHGRGLHRTVVVTVLRP